MSTATFTSYPVFEPNQVLTDVQLNQLRDYLDEQTRLTRTKLIGMGIACGLEVNFKAKNGTGTDDTISISKGTGITSQGFLISICDCDTIYYRPYILPLGVEYDAFIDGNGDQLPLFELLGELSDPINPEEKPLSDFEMEVTGATWEDYVVLLFLECFDKDLKSCLTKSCDEIGINRLFTLRKLLISKTDLDTVLSTTKNMGGAMHPGKYDLPNISMPRVLFDHTKAHSKNYVDFSENYVNSFDNDDTGSGDDVFIKLFGGPGTGQQGALQDTYDIFKPILEPVYGTGNPFDDTTIDALRSHFIDSAGPTLGIQYFYDFIKDMILAYNEFREAAFDLMSKCTCCDDMSLFERHLMLGEVIATGECEPSKYRQVLVQTPIYNDQTNLLKKIISLHKRMVLMLENFDKGLLVTGTQLSTIKITPSCEKKPPLSVRAIPYYYDIDAETGATLGSLEASWNYDVMRKCPTPGDPFILSYHNHDETVKGPITTPLLFDQDPYSFLRIEGHLKMDHKQVKDRLNKLKKDFNLSFDVVALKLDPSTTPDLTSIEIDYHCGFEDLHEEYHIFRNKFVHVLENLIKALNILDKDDIVDEILERLEEFIALLPPCISDFDYEDFKDHYKDSIQRIIDVGLIEESEVTDVLCLINEIEEFLGIDIDEDELDVVVALLYNILDSFFYAKLLRLNYAFKRREYLIKRQFIFSNYIQKHTGPRHLAGVEPGGTFIIVYHDNAAEPEPLKVIADFSLPYICCDCGDMEICDDDCNDDDDDKKIMQNLAIPPFARPELAITDKGTSIDICVADSDDYLYPDNIELILDTGATSDQGGDIELSYPETGGPAYFHYTPPPAPTGTTGFVGIDQFDYTIRNLCNGLTDTAKVTVIVKETNVPTSLDLSNNTVDENKAPDTVVGTFFVPDDSGFGNPPPPKQYTFSLENENDGYPDNSSFFIDGDALKTRESFDFEAKHEYSIFVRVEDEACASFEKEFTITVNDVNEPHMVENQTFIIPENSPDQADVGTVVISDPDADIGTDLEFVITAGNINNAFKVDDSSGLIEVNDTNELDYEVTPLYYLTMTVEDTRTGGSIDTAIITIALTNVPEPPVVEEQTFFIRENSPMDAPVAPGPVLTSEQDAGETLAFSILGSPPPDAFAIHPTTGQLTVNDPAQMNFEAKSVFTFDVEVEDPTARIASAEMTVKLINHNEEPIIDKESLSMSIPENLGNDDVVGTIKVNDPEDTTGKLSFEFIGYNTGAFKIGFHTGIITVRDTTQLDFETTPKFELTVFVVDSGGYSDAEKVTITLEDVPEKPIVNDQTMEVLENTKEGFAVGNVDAIDQDTGDTPGSLTYQIVSISPAPESTTTPVAFRFSVLGEKHIPGTILVNNSSLLDYERTPIYTLIVKVKDQGGLSDNATITINLKNVDESPVVQAGQVFNVAEGSTQNTPVGTVIATDPEEGALKYELTAGNINDTFVIHRDSGALAVNTLVAASPNKFTLSVRVTDLGNNAYSGDVVVNVYSQAVKVAFTEDELKLVNLTELKKVATLMGLSPTSLNKEETVAAMTLEMKSSDGLTLKEMEVLGTVGLNKILTRRLTVTNDTRTYDITEINEVMGILVETR